MYVIGTAGHVDHGKSTLVEALTGIDPDRLREEKERGLTIDLGFAWLTLPSGREVSIVDVPGHERFIKNMLAGAGGVDLAMLVVAADEGPMPQTREHLAILDLLDVPGGVVVITKADLVEPAYVDLVEAELEETLAGSRLAGAPVVRVSSVTREGLERLLEVLDAALDATPPKRDIGRPRLPIDRAFAVQGFGVVVTGTLVDGTLAVGEEVELQPGELRARVRGLQRHRTRVNRLQPGTRAAVNLSGIRLEDVRRGMVLARPGTVPAVRSVDVRLRGTRLITHPLQHDAGVTFLSATAESEAKLRLLDTPALEPGAEAWAQLVLDEPVAVAEGDHCIVRTSNETAAGGRIVAVNPRRHRRNHAPTLEALELRLRGAPADRLLDLLLTAPVPRNGAAEALGGGIDATGAGEAVAQLAQRHEVVERAGLLLATRWVDGAVGRLVGALEEYLADHPLRPAAPREHARTALRYAPVVFDVVVAESVARGAVDDLRAGLAPKGYRVRLTPRQEEAVARFLSGLRGGRYSPPTDALPDAALLAYLSGAGLVEDTGAGVVFDREVFEEMLEKTRAHLQERGSITLAEARDLFDTSRKYAQAFLEHLDDLRVTRRTGDTRVLRGPGGPG